MSVGNGDSGEESRHTNTRSGPGSSGRGVDSAGANRRLNRWWLSPPSPLWLILAIILIGAMQLIWWYVLWYRLGWDRGWPMDHLGQLGDLFGGVNALFTGLAFAGLIYTILWQRYDLHIQSKAL